MHKLLERQLRRHLGGKVPDGLESLFEAIAQAYQQADDDRLLLERSLDLTSNELLGTNARLRKDIDALEHARRKLQEQAGEFQQALRASPFAVAILRHEHYLFVNAAWASCFGRHVDDFAGRVVVEWVHAADRDRLYRLATGRSEAGVAQQPAILRVERKNGEYSDLEVHPVQQIRFDRELAILVPAVDVTERRRLEARLLLADRMVSVGTLAAGVAHEINNPLSYVMSNLQFLSDASLWAQESGSEEASQALREAQEGVARVRDIVRDLKTFSRADEETRSLVDLRNILDTAVNMSRNEVRHRARLNRDYRPIPSVVGNAAKLGQVFLNLIINAAHAMPDGRAHENEITIRTRTGLEGRAVVEVVDTGHGIPKEIIQRIFDPFFTTKPIGVGTGLGLSICQGIVAALHGEIEVESEVGKGTTFRVSFPPAVAVSGRAPAAAMSPDPGQGRLAILVIDDDPMVGRSIERLLRREHDVQVVSGARKALAALRSGQSFDVFLCDLMMPDMTGADFFRELNEIAPAFAKRIVFMTGGAFTPESRAFIDEISNPRIEKPFDRQALNAALHACMDSLPRSEGGAALRLVAV
jgi:two-component system cell cycle sensor histidine kinase/response regulator CckA